jgi:NAD(P)-dependent dehydrogenase (short-subunit alcohol dehydrogenase family)
MQQLAGRTAVVTGGASGIGLEVARALGAERMRVVLADVEAGALARAEAELADAGVEVLAVPADVAKLADVERLAARTLERFGAVHVLHNNAGVMIGGGVADLSIEDWEWVLGVDLWGVIYGVKVFLPLIERAGEGHIVNTASSAGLYAQSFIAPYNVAKFGVVALTETLCRELAQRGSEVGASVLCPGAVATRIVESDRNRADRAAPSPAQRAFQQQAAKLIQGRGIPPAQVAALVVEAIRDRRFWILPHPKWIEVLRERVEGMLDAGRLTSGFGG